MVSVIHSIFHFIFSFSFLSLPSSPFLGFSLWLLGFSPPGRFACLSACLILQLRAFWACILEFLISSFIPSSVFLSRLQLLDGFLFIPLFSSVFFCFCLCALSFVPFRARPPPHLCGEGFQHLSSFMLPFEVRPGYFCLTLFEILFLRLPLFYFS
ncbi:hypothetical protein CPC08DRAFT_197944 [Agrocybe pediades]|nr:hypothetical protein CPC08DRAFT_197944 [Agrocybe pediades]